jgi:syntaxin 1B/2/3
MHASRRGQSRAVLSEVQNRHDDIKKIEKTILVSFIRNGIACLI